MVSHTLNPDNELMPCTVCRHLTTSADGLCPAHGGDGTGLPLEDDYGEESGPEDVCDDDDGYDPAWYQEME